jgi:hypothetical protein
MSCSVVPSGVYFGFSLGEMNAELARYKATVKAMTAGATGSVTSASENGSSVTFGPNSDMTLKQWQVAIQDALNRLDPTNFTEPVRSSTIGVFR